MKDPNILVPFFCSSKNTIGNKIEFKNIIIGNNIIIFFKLCTLSENDAYSQ